MLAAMGYVIADVAADGLTTEYAKAESIERRGTTQTTAYMTRTVGQACSTLFVGLCMNSKLYNGSYSWGLSFEVVCACFAVPAALMVPISAFLVREPRITSSSEDTPSAKEYMNMCWDLLKSKACFFVICYGIFTPMIAGMTSTAQAQVKIYWAGVQNFQNQMFSLVGYTLFALGLFYVRKRLLNSSWRMILAVTVVTLQVVDFTFSTLTIFNIVRNQYFYLGETVLIEIPTAANFVVSTFVIVEMADHGNEGMVYGLLTTSMNLGTPVARALGNYLYGLFRPSLSDSANYIRDTPEFRTTVFKSFLLTYFFAFASLGLLFLLPNQKAHAQHRKKHWPKSTAYAVITVVVLFVALTYSLTVNFLSMFPSTMCMKVAGGDGCVQAPGKAD